MSSPPNITRALVVGGTSGIGHAIALRIATESKSSTVIVSGRTKPENLPPNMEFRQLDASSMRAIKAYTDAYKATQEPKLDLLVLTQGIFTIAGRTETPEGIDNKMALHYYGRQLLIRELTPALKDDAKVLIVLDAKAGDPSKLNWEDLDLKKTFSLANAASHCTSMNDAMVQYFAAQGGNKRHFVHAYPGLVRTNLGRDLPWYMRGPAEGLARALGATPAACGANLLRGTYECAAANEKQGRFWSFINDKGVAINNKVVWDEGQRQKVVDHTWKIVDEAIGSKN